jgi:sugar lactone lactonase YvrE
MRTIQSITILFLILILAGCRKHDTVRPLTITSFTPSSGLAGTAVRIYGSGFIVDFDPNVVKFNGIRVTVNEASESILGVIVPNDKNCTGYITVTVNGKTVTSGSIFTFIEPSPKITSIDPVYAGYDDTLTVSGANFCPTISDNTVKLNGIDAKVVSASDTLLKVIVPKDKNCSGKVTVISCNKTAVSDTSFIYQTRATSVITFTGQLNPGAVDASGINAQFWAPYDLALDAAGNLIVSEVWNEKIRRITPLGMVSTIAGSGTQGYLDGPALTAQFHFPMGLTLDNAGNIYVAEYDNQSIRKIDLSGNVTTTFINGAKGSVAYPGDVVVDADNVYVTDQDNNRICKVSFQTGLLSVLSGNGNWGMVNGDPLQTQFYHPGAMTLDNMNNILVADYVNGCIRKIARTSGYTSSVTLNIFSAPAGIVMDGVGNIYVTDVDSCCIYRIDPNGKTARIVGSTSRGYVDGKPLDAQFNNPRGIVVDASGNLFVADNGNNCIRKIIME